MALLLPIWQKFRISHTYLKENHKQCQFHNRNMQCLNSTQVSASLFSHSRASAGWLQTVGEWLFHSSLAGLLLNPILLPPFVTLPGSELGGVGGGGREKGEEKALLNMNFAWAWEVFEAVSLLEPSFPITGVSTTHLYRNPCCGTLYLFWLLTCGFFFSLWAYGGVSPC